MRKTAAIFWGKLLETATWRQKHFSVTAFRPEKTGRGDAVGGNATGSDGGEDVEVGQPTCGGIDTGLLRILRSVPAGTTRFRSSDAWKASGFIKSTHLRSPQALA
jgi:hypothetical protein